MYSIYIILQEMFFCGAWRSLVARPAGGREVVGSNPAAPTKFILKWERIKKMKKLLILVSMVLIFSLACNDENEIIEPEVSKDSIVFPFDSRNNGKFLAIYRNYSENTISVTFVMSQSREVMKNSQNYDFCPDLLNIRNGINTDWVPINLNLPIIPEDNVQNKNDHPNLVSYTLPMGTYVALLMDGENCNKDQYHIFDIKTNDAMNSG